MSRAPLEATGRCHRVAPYRPGGRHGNNQQNNDAKCTLFAGLFDGHRDVAVLYRTHRQMVEVCGFHESH